MAGPAAGQDVDTYCTRCKMELAHVVIAVASGKIARVQCKTCGGVHAYRDKTRSRTKRGATSSASKSTGTRQRRSGAGAARSNYGAQMAGRDLSRAKAYRPRESFEREDIIDHKTFGLGLVLRELDDNKIEVLFRDGPRTLAHRR